MGAFRKRSNLCQFHDHGSATIGRITVPVTKQVKQKDSREPLTVVEFKEQSVEDYARSLSMPASEDYQLKDMLKSGYVPEEVPVSGMLDNPDPTALENVGRDTELFSKLVNMTPEPAPEPVPEPEPSNAE